MVCRPIPTIHGRQPVIARHRPDSFGGLLIFPRARRMLCFCVFHFICPPADFFNFSPLEFPSNLIFHIIISFFDFTSPLLSLSRCEVCLRFRLIPFLSRRLMRLYALGLALPPAKAPARLI